MGAGLDTCRTYERETRRAVSRRSGPLLTDSEFLIAERPGAKPANVILLTL